MKLIPCPLNGLRNAEEFVCGGEVQPEPDASQLSAADWAQHVFHRDNRAGLVREWWLHVPSGYWFIAERDTLSDRFLRSYPASELFAKRTPVGPAEPGDR
ncbi:MAG: sarcosine oxidase subunit delta [Alphaproteobacteria bacterium]|nr:sarcosine oxidase subunit delta [Alphaproteobacteria bacterium]